MSLLYEDQIGETLGCHSLSVAMVPEFSSSQYNYEIIAYYENMRLPKKVPGRTLNTKDKKDYAEKYLTLLEEELKPLLPPGTELQRTTGSFSHESIQVHLPPRLANPQLDDSRSNDEINQDIGKQIQGQLEKAHAAVKARIGEPQLGGYEAITDKKFEVKEKPVEIFRKDAEGSFAIHGEAGDKYFKRLKAALEKALPEDFTFKIENYRITGLTITPPQENWQSHQTQILAAFEKAHAGVIEQMRLEKENAEQPKIKWQVSDEPVSHEARFARGVERSRGRSVRGRGAVASNDE